MPTEISGATGVNKVQSSAIETGDLPTGSVLQTKSVGYPNGTTTAISVNGSGSAVLMTITMTTQANSKVAMWFDSGQTNKAVSVAPDVYFGVDNTAVDKGTKYYFYPTDVRTVISKVFLTDALTAGSHTFTVIGEAFNGTVTYNYQAQDSGVFMIQEIAG